MKRVHVVIHGLVQGVSFRYYTERQANQLGLKGWVRNLPNGAVEAVFEGTQGEVQAMVEWCHSGPPSARVDRVEVNHEEYRGDFETFEITY